MLVIRKKCDKEPKGLDGRENSGICLFEEENKKEKEKEERTKREKRKGGRRTEPKRGKGRITTKTIVRRAFPMSTS